MENVTQPHSSYIPHYLLRDDPFASKLSWEADIVAAIYICVIGKSATAEALLPHHKRLLLFVGSLHWCEVWMQSAAVLL